MLNNIDNNIILSILIKIYSISDAVLQAILRFKIIILIILIPWTALFIFWRATNYPIEFYGLVLDEDDNPIPGVTVAPRLHGMTVTPTVEPSYYFIRTIRRKTNKDGRFKIKGYYGYYLSFQISYRDALIKKGYKIISDNFPTRFTSDGMPNSIASPVVFRMRKLEEPTFVFEGLQRKTQYTIEFNKHTEWYNLIRNTYFYTEKTQTHDFVINGKWQESENRWVITFAPGTKNGGIQRQNKLLYTAPSDGYKPEITFYVYNKSNKYSRADTIAFEDFFDEPIEPVAPRSAYADKYYFYLISREYGIYSRISMEDPLLYVGKIILNLHVTTNPYAGQRSLELEPNISFELKKALDKEIKEAFAKDPNAIIPPPTSEMFKMPDSKIPQIMAERQRLISK